GPRDHDAAPAKAAPAARPMRCPPPSGPISDTVVTGVCTVTPRIAYQVFACRRSSSVLKARVAPYAPGVADATASTRIPRVDLCKPCAWPGLMKMADAPGRSSYSITNDTSTSSAAVVDTFIVAVSDLNRLITSRPDMSGNPAGTPAPPSAIAGIITRRPRCWSWVASGRV